MSSFVGLGAPDEAQTNTSQLEQQDSQAHHPSGVVFYSPLEQRYNWKVHPEMLCGRNTGNSWIFARTKFRSLNYSFSTYLDMVEDDLSLNEAKKTSSESARRLYLNTATRPVSYHRLRYTDQTAMPLGEERATRICCSEKAFTYSNHTTAGLGWSQYTNADPGTLKERFDCRLHINGRPARTHKFVALYALTILAGGTCVAGLFTGLKVPGGLRTLTGVVSTSAAVANIGVHANQHPKTLRWSVEAFCVASFGVFLALLWKSLKEIRRPQYVFATLLAAATFAGSALFADKIEDTVDSILAFGPLVATVSAALLYMPFRFGFGFVVGENTDVELQTLQNTHQGHASQSRDEDDHVGRSNFMQIFQWW